MRKIFLFVIFLTLGADAVDLVHKGTIQLSNLPEFARRTPKEIDCRLLDDIKGTLTCLTPDRRSLATLMGRISFFAEGSPAKTIADPNDPAYLGSPQARYDGHDILGEDFLQFYSKVEAACAKDKKYCLNPEEQKLKEVILKMIREHKFKDFVVISATANTNYLDEILSHELLHARFFLNKDYQSKVKKFWNETVTAEDKKAIRSVLARNYNLSGPNGDLLLLNEFQAYSLQDNPDTGELRNFSAKYSDSLRLILAEHLPSASQGTLPSGQQQSPSGAR